MFCIGEYGRKAPYKFLQKLFRLIRRTRMTNLEISTPSITSRLLALSRRFVRWLTNPKVFLALIMLVLMFYMVIVPLYRMVETTVTWQRSDIARNPGAVVGKITTYHYVRMLSGVLGRIYTFTPLKHSMTIAIGAT